MSGPVHTYGPTCLLYDPPPENNAPPASDPNIIPGPPKLRPQFFYTSSFPIDDPLTPLPPPSSGSSTSQVKLPPQPFSVRDNIALEEAWAGLRSALEGKNAEDGRDVEDNTGAASSSRRDLSRAGKKSSVARKSLSTRLEEGDARNRVRIALEEGKKRDKNLGEDTEAPLFEDGEIDEVLATLEQQLKGYDAAISGENNKSDTDLMLRTLHDVIAQVSGASEIRTDLPQPVVDAVSRVLRQDITREKKPFQALSSRQDPPRRISVPIRIPDKSSRHSEAESGGLHTTQGRGSPDEIDNIRSNHRKRHSPPLDRKSKAPKYTRTSSPGGEEDGSDSAETSTPRFGSLHVNDTNISGSPFARAPVRDEHSRSLGRSANPTERMMAQLQGDKAPHPSSQADTAPIPRPTRPISKRLSTTNTPQVASAPSNVEPDAVVPVGASRLHLVELPNLQMKPMYWNPVHDVSPVVRATWFYKNTMLPLEPDLANQLEAGFMYMQPWTQTWQDELDSCVEHGAEAELKIVHRIWPKEENKDPAKPGTALDMKPQNPSQSALSAEERSPMYSFQENQAAGSAPLQEELHRLFKNSSVIYVNSKDAQILRPSLLPSASRGRRPLGPIRKGREIGIPIVRGFDRQNWEKLHPVKFTSTSAKNFMKAHQVNLRETANGRRQICYACQMEDKRVVAKDLVLVIHGIGQKLSERVESFHFTHAINAFRRQVNVELNSDAAGPLMRPGLESIMVLPVNWRSTLSFEDPGVETSLTDTPAENRFALKDITPETLPAVRSLISDVMLDIPYYMSHHKQKMIQAVVKEANRIYRLWCQNNPGFQTDGRVHLIAHSLGSIMAMDILSQQPTLVPTIDFERSPISNTMFEFDTKNMFFCGSPAGFFLLLNKATLLPRKNRDKGDWDYENNELGIAGEAGTFGCLAVDNLYNVMHETDPIAYRLNAAVDTDLANSLKPAYVPSSSTSFLQSLGSVFRWTGSKPAPSQPPTSSSTTSISGSTQRQQQQQQQQPPRGSLAAPGMLSKLPSNIEMETHDFTREEIAERRMVMINDNGQIDFYLSGGGGPLNIQYLNMLSAHSSYWILPDFIRFLVVEIGRVQGREGTLVALRAEKKKGWKSVKG
ncbi:hypothetical protein AJ80_08407 [Polytolypa hystricis UAMH7299]|uniref:DDHD domain-containing protein n=1 Tax=Polytolypa hystricis (strain UAMH7299) TaxID=1447883 RepID=A0A2B7X8X9_POLH7|nr:hypothetical protein AJ80_08407 [Polytolypa hystricis UAMH7299]